MGNDHPPLLAIGDIVTHAKWGSDTEVIKRITTDRHGKVIAVFVGGGFWRLDQLVAICR